MFLCKLRSLVWRSPLSPIYSECGSAVEPSTCLWMVLGGSGAQMAPLSALTFGRGVWSRRFFGVWWLHVCSP